MGSICVTTTLQALTGGRAFCYVSEKGPGETVARSPTITCRFPDDCVNRDVLVFEKQQKKCQEIINNPLPGAHQFAHKMGRSTSSESAVSNPVRHWVSDSGEAHGNTGNKARLTS
jgi:hypothetical protein